MRGLVLGFLCALGLSSAWAAADLPPFEDPQKQALYHELINELRCPKCQNQTIADSNAPLALDLRERTHQMVADGNNKQQVIDYMVARYGDFVHYKPPVTLATSILWWGPVVAIVVGLLVVLMRVRKPQEITLSEAEEVRLAALRQESEDDR